MNADQLKQIRQRHLRNGTTVTGVRHTPGRDQPFTVWWDDEVIWFDKTKVGAEDCLERERRFRGKAS